MTDPIGTAQERELIERLRRTRSSLDGYGDITRPINPDGPAAADALQSRIAEGGRLESALRRVLEWWPEGSENGRASRSYGDGFSKDIANARAALSLQRRPTDRGA